MRTPKKKPNPTLIGLVAVGVIILGIIASLIPWVQLDNTPKPLGDRLEYIGKQNYGCTIGFCDAKAGTSYFYATDMSIDEVGKYFKKARLKEPPTSESDFTSIWLYNDEIDKDFFLYYYNPENLSDSERAALNLRNSSKNLMKIDGSDYQNAKSSL